MLKKTLTVLSMAVFVAAACSNAATAQDAGAGYVPAAQAAASTQPNPPQQPPARQPQQFLNIKLEINITMTGHRGEPLAPMKSVVMHAVDRDNARVRTGRSASAAGQPANLVIEPGPVLNVDATPEILSNGRLRVSLSFEYRPDASADKMEPIHINQRLSAVLEDGKPMVVSQTSDPTGDRNVKVELKATILR